MQVRRWAGGFGMAFGVTGRRLMVIGMVLLVLLLALLWLAWRDGGREDMREIAVPVNLPEHGA